MREIRVRCKRIDTGPLCDSWVTGTGITDRLVDNCGNIEKGTWLWCNYVWIEVIPETVGQFTGLIDMDGKEIYEGDIVLNDDDEVIIEPPRWFGCDAFTIYGYKGLDSFQDTDSEQEISRYIKGCKVIGNIHEE